MIELKQLRWSNIFSYGKDNSINFNTHPVVQLLGSNGNGKSSIALILEECLFNKNSKNIKKGNVPNRFSKDKSYSIELDFSKDGDEYIIVVQRKGATQKVVLFKNNIDISSHTATDTFKELESILGIDQKTFSQLIYQSSTSSLEFLTATDTNRKKFLIELLGLDEYVKIHERVKDLFKGANEQLISAESKLNTIQEWLQKQEGSILDKKELEEVPSEPKDLIDNLSNLKARANNIDTLNKRIIQNNQYISMREQIDLSILSADTSVHIDVHNKESEVAVLKHTLNEKSSLLKKFKSLQSIKICPTCMQEIDENKILELVPNIQSDIDEINSQLTNISTELLKARQLISLKNKQQEIQTNFEKYSLKIDHSIPTILEDKDDLDNSIRLLDNKISEVLTSIKQVSDRNAKVSAHNSRVEVVLQQISEYKEELEIQHTLVEGLKTEVSLIDILKKSFSTNGLIAYKIENLVRELENITNVYLNELSGGKFQLSFGVQNDKLNVIITDNGIDVEISALSSGEKARVNTATLLAIRKLMSSISKTKINLLILDETISTLDTYGKEKLVEILLNEPELNTFIVSHDYTHPLLEKITVIKEGNTSSIENG